MPSVTDPHPPGDHATLAHLSARPLETASLDFSSSLDLFGSLSDDDFDQLGRAFGATFSAHALIDTLFGHDQHHAEALEERYLCARRGRVG